MPEGRLPEDSWLVGMGLIILGVNAVKYLNGIKMDGFFVVIGLLALGYGLSSIYGLSLPIISILLIFAGAFIIFKPMFWKSEDKEWEWDWDWKC